jgi:tetratricopeptide (TPR) repeat protein
VRPSATANSAIQRHAGDSYTKRALILAAIPLVAVACATAPHGESSPVDVNASDLVAAKAQQVADSRAAYHFMLGYQAELAQDTERAIREYESALQSDPAAATIKARLAVLYYSMGDLKLAVRYADEAAQGQGLDGQGLSQLAGVYAGAGQQERALALFDRAIQAEPGKSDVYFSKGLLLLSLKRVSDAEQTIKEGIALAPDSPVGYYHLGRVGIESKQFDAAVKNFERAIAVNPSFEPAYLALGTLHEVRQEREQAIAVYRRYLDGINPRNREVRQHLVQLFITAKDYQAALAELERILAEDPDDLDAQLRVSLMYGEMKEYSKAIERLQRILVVRPAELKVRDYLGYLFEENKEHEKALEAYELNLKLEPTYFEGQLHLGVLLYRLKRIPESIAHLREATKLNPKQPESHIVLGLAYLQSDQFEAASQAFEEGIKFNPKNADLHFNLGTAYDKLNRFDDVVRAMETALKLDPHHADALNYLGYSYADRGIKTEEALALTKQAVALKPDNGYYVDSLGWAFYKMGRLDEALTQIKRAVALAGDDPVIFEHLGEIYLKQNLLHDAREAWLHSLELDPSNTKLIERFQERGMGDPAQEERVRRAVRRVSEQKAAQKTAP